MLRERTFNGVLWNFAQRLSTAGISLVVTLILARWLDPSDFGLVAMVAVFIALAKSLMDSGFTQALIRKADAGPADFSTAFYANLVLGLLTYAALFVTAPLIARFYHQPNLVAVVRVLGLVVPINATWIVQVAILSRRLDFKSQLRVTIPATAISGVLAISLAFFWGAGVWALVTQLVAASVLTSFTYWSLRLWRPQWTFSAKSLREMYGFGSKLFAAGFIETAFQNMYVLVIARMFSATIAGQYFFASKIRNLLLQQLVSAIQTATYPAFSSLQHDNTKLKAGYREVVQVTAFILCPALLFTAALARPLFQTLLPDKWLPSVPYLQLLCLAGLMYPLHVVNLNVLKVKGRSDLFLYVDLLKKLMLVGILAISYRYGVIGILVGQIVSSLLSYLPNSYFSAKLIDYPIREQLTDFFPALLLAAFLAVLAYFACEVSFGTALVKLLSLGAITSAGYLGISYLLKLPAFLLALRMVKGSAFKADVV